MRRPTVDVIVPTLAPVAAATRMASLSRRAGDTLTVVDNRPEARASTHGPVRVVAAPERRSSYLARNRGAASGSAEWLLFLDGDVDYDADLLDRLFDPVPDESVGVLAGAIEDVVVVDSPVSRWIAREGKLSQRHTLTGDWPYAQTAHCAVRRAAFDGIGGFVDDVRSAGDADLCFRLTAAGWKLEARAAAVRHEARATVPALLRQMARHGAGAAWIERRHPGSAPRTTTVPGALWWLARTLPRAADAERVLPPLAALAFAVGRRLPNEVR